MRNVPDYIQTLWDDGGPFIGENAPHTRVTVEPDWQLTTENQVGNFKYGPVRWWQRKDNSQDEVEVPNIKMVQIDRNIDSDAAQVNITLNNQWHFRNDQISVDGELGQPGYFTFSRGEEPDARARWSHDINDWNQVLIPNALIRIYQGYGGHDKTLQDALDDGNVMLTGVFLIDNISLSTDGFLQLSGRDMAKLLIDQFIYPPLVPESRYPLSYFRYRYLRGGNPYILAGSKSPSFDQKVHLRNPRTSYDPDGLNLPQVGHYPSDAINDAGGYWLSEAKASQDDFVYYEVECNDHVDAVCWIVPGWGQGGEFWRDFTIYISIYENGKWADGAPGDIIPGPAGMNIPFVSFEANSYLQVPNDPGTFGRYWVLPRVYSNVTKIRWTFTHLYPTNMVNGPGDPTPNYRAAMGEFKAVNRRSWGFIDGYISIGSGPDDLGYAQLGASGGGAGYGPVGAGCVVQGSGAGNIDPEQVWVSYRKSNRRGDGAYTVRKDGVVYENGTATHWGDLKGTLPSPNICDLAPHPSNTGYWMLSYTGKIYPFGPGARYFGNSQSHVTSLANLAIEIESTVTGDGYWVLHNDGRVFAFGNAVHYGDSADVAMTGIATAFCATYTGLGYWIVTSTGHVYAFGDAIYSGGANALPAGSPDVLDPADPITDMDRGTGHNLTSYLLLPGIDGNYCSAPHVPDLDIVNGDLDIRVCAAMSDWQSDEKQTLVAKSDESNTVFEFSLVPSAARLSFTRGTTEVLSDSGSPYLHLNHRPLWLRVTYTASTGAVKFYYQDGQDWKTEPTSWTQIGSTVSSASGAIPNAEVPIDIGTLHGQNHAAGRIYRVIISDVNSGATPSSRVIASPDFTILAENQTAFVDAQGNLWSVYQNSARILNGRLRLAGYNRNAAVSRDTEATSITGDFELRIRASAADWGTSVERTLASKWTDIDNARSWTFSIQNGYLKFKWSTDGSDDGGSLKSVQSSEPVVAGIRNWQPNSEYWLRVTLQFADGGYSLKFYVAEEDDPAWAQIGSAREGSGYTEIDANYTPLLIGASSASNGRYVKVWDGNIRTFQLFDKVNGPKVADVDFSKLATGASEFTDNIARVWNIFNSGGPSRIVQFDDNGYTMTANNGAIFNFKTTYWGSVTRKYEWRYRVDADYKDYADIIRELCLWAGFWLYEENYPGSKVPQVFGNIETTGIFNSAEDGMIPEDTFDKRSVMDAITQMKEVVGYNFWVDEEGGVRFEMPNWFRPGNVIQETGERVEQWPVVDEERNLYQLQVDYTDNPVRSEIIISTADPEANLQETRTARLKVEQMAPESARLLRGMVKPMMWVNGMFQSKEELELMAKRVAAQILFTQRKASVSTQFNPAIQINDQIQVFERQTAEIYLHYVRGVRTQHNIETGEMKMDLETHWLGTPEELQTSNWGLLPYVDDDVAKRNWEFKC